MKKYRVTVPYWTTYEAVIVAASEKEARDKFDELETDELKENWQGVLEGCTPEETIEEIGND